MLKVHVRFLALLPVLFVFFLLLGTSSAFAADAVCGSSSLFRWDKFGEIAFESTTNKNDKEMLQFLRRVIFRNGDGLIELDKGQGKKRLLHLKSGVALYDGLSSEEIILPGKNPFMFIGMVLGGVLGPLTVAFPCGIGDVPTTGKQIAGTWERAQFEGKVIRTSAQEVKFDLTLTLSGRDEIAEKAVNVIANFAGVWVELPQPPLPDDFSVVGWRGRSKEATPAGFSTLGEVRSLPQGSPGGTQKDQTTN